MATKSTGTKATTAKAAPKAAVKTKDAAADFTQLDPPLETIFVSSGQEHYAPIPFFSFDVGPISLTTTIRESETYEDAIARCHEVLNAGMQTQFTQKMEAFFDRCGQLDTFMENRQMATRAQRDVVSPNSSKPQADMSKPPVERKPAEPPTVDNMLGFTGNPKAESNGDLPTPGQQTLFAKLQKQTGVDGQELCRKIFGVELHNLHRAAMSKLMDYVNDNFEKDKGDAPPASRPADNRPPMQTAISNPDDEYPF